MFFEWKLVWVILIYKGDDEIDVVNYRLILLFSILGKIFEFVVNDVLVMYVFVFNDLVFDR